MHKHFQRVLLGGFHRVAQIGPFFSHIWRVFELGVFPLQRDGIIEEELRSVLETIWESIPGEVPMQGVRDIGEHEGGVAGQGFGEDGRESGECIVGADRNVRDGAIRDNDDSSDGVNVVLDLSGDTPLVEAVLLNTPSVGQARCVEDANLGGRSYISACSKSLEPTIMPLLLVNS